MTTELHKILCVDDEPRVLEALNRHLRERFQVLTASNGAAAIDIIGQHRDLAVVLSDMRMPEMDGATLLRHTRALQPNAVRILLTGQADVAAAIKAINDGQIFRFLTKPCPPDQLLTVLEEAIRQYELVTAERLLLQRTVVGSIRALADIMMLVSPAVVGRAIRLRQRVSALASELNIEDRWQLEAAALLSHLGQLSLPEVLTEKLVSGEPLDGAESLRLRDAVRAANRLIAHVPRLEPVSALLRAVLELDETDNRATGSPADTLHVQVLNLAMDLERLQSEGLPAAAMLDTLETLAEYTPNVLAAARNCLLQGSDSLQRVEIAVSELEVGMVLDEDLLTTREVLIAPRGCEVTVSFLEHIRHFMRELSRPTVLVFQPAGGMLSVESAANS